jgi:lipoprotein NlpI
MRAWAIFLSALLWGCAASSQNGGTSTPDTVFSDFDACDQAVLGPGIDALIDRCSRALNSGLMPEDPTATALIRRGNFYAFKGDYTRAKQDYDRALAIKPMARFIRGNRAVVEFLEGDYASAFKGYDADPSSSGNWSSLIQRGTAWRYRGELEKAIRDLTKANDNMHYEAQILANRGLAYTAHGDYALALADFDMALKFEPDFLPREIKLATERGDPNDLDHAVPGFGQDIVLKPDYFLLQRARGFALLMLGRPSEAADALQKYLRTQPGDVVAEIMFQLAAHRAYQAMLSDIDTSMDETWPKSILRYLKGDATREDVLKAAGTADPQRECSARFYFGEADLTGKRRDSARAEFQRAITVCPKGAFEQAAAAAELARL